MGASGYPPNTVSVLSSRSTRAGERTGGLFIAVNLPLHVSDASPEDGQPPPAIAFMQNRQGLLTDRMGRAEVSWCVGCRDAAAPGAFHPRTFATTTAGVTQGDGWIESLHPAGGRHARRAWQHSLRTGNLMEITCRIEQGPDRYRWVLLRALPRSGREGEERSWLGTCVDVHQGAATTGGSHDP